MSGPIFALGQPPEVIMIGVSTFDRGEARYVRWPTDCLHLHRYEATLLLPSGDLPIRPGAVSANEARETFGHRWRHDGSTHLFVHFRARIDSGKRRAFPVVRQLEDAEFEELYEDALEALGWFRTQRTRAEARVWDILWRLAQETEGGRSPTHPALQRAVRLIETRLGEPISLDDLSADAGISHSQLLRLFRARFGVTLSQYVRARRVERARNLLLHSTMPIKTIAHAVGIPDLQHFNKVVRQSCGQSPSGLRRSAEE